MKAMILTAGRGERLRPFTDHTPKPLLKINGRPMIEFLIEALQAAGINELVLNLAHLGHQIKATLGDGKRYNVSIQYSMEGLVGLETGGGIYRALPLLGEDPFIVVNGDIFTHFDFNLLLDHPVKLAHLVLVPNPPHHPQGDFYLDNDGDIVVNKNPKSTFSGIGIYRPELFEHCQDGKFPLAPLLRNAMKQGQVTGERYDGVWMDVGTPERLRFIEQNLNNLC